MRVLVVALFFAYSCPLMAQDQPELVINQGHTQMINHLQFSTKGKYLATSGVDNQVIVWDFALKRVFRRFGFSRCERMVFSENESLLGAMNSDQWVVWNLVSGNAIDSGEMASMSNLYFYQNKFLFYLNPRYELVRRNLTDHSETIFRRDPVVYGMSGSKDEMVVCTNSHFIRYNIETLGVIDSVAHDEKITFEPHYDKPNQKVYFTNNTQHFVLDLKSGKKKDLKVSGFSRGATMSSSYLLIPAVNIHVFKYPSLKNEPEVKTVWGTQDVALHPQQPWVAFSNNMNWKVYDLKEREEIYFYQNQVHRIWKMDVSDDEKYLTASSGLDGSGLHVWNLKKNQLQTQPILRNEIKISSDNTILSLNNRLQICEEDIRTHASECMPLEGTPFQLDFCSHCNWLSFMEIPDRKFAFKVIDTEKREVESSVKTDLPITGLMLMDFNYCNEQHYVLFCDLTHLHLYDVKKNTIRKIKIPFQYIRSIALKDDFRALVTGFTTTDSTGLFEIDLENSSVVSLSKFDVSPSLAEIFPLNQQFLGVSYHQIASSIESLMFLNAQKEKLCEVTNHFDRISGAKYFPEKKKLYVSSWDGSISINDAENCSMEAKIIPYGSEGDFFVTTPDNYYMSSKKALQAVSFRYNSQLVPFEQFDLLLNRPDIVANRMGFSSKMLVDAYQNAYQKRLKKMGFKEDELTLSLSLPTCKILDFKQFITQENEINVKVALKDSLFDLDRVMVYVNGVSVFGSSGISIKNESTHSKEMNLTIPLMPGKNTVEVSCYNSNGVESLRDFVEVIQDQPDKKDLYIITIGVSDYADDRFDLDYPAKDAQDILDFFRGDTSQVFDEIHSKQYLNDHVTYEILDSIEDFLKKIRSKDVLMIYVAGHGLLDEEFNYYFGTHDLDFDNPKERGIPFEKLEEIIEKVKAIRKLLFMDTCHSGEVDEDEMELAQNSDPLPDGVKTRAAGIGVRRKIGLGLYDSVELMKTLFSDIRKGSGAQVISSAGGGEFAFESASWKNGLFTFCLLEGLKTKAADQDKNGRVSVLELKDYVTTQVDRLSGGLQKPTSRVENTRLDFELR